MSAGPTPICQCVDGTVPNWTRGTDLGQMRKPLRTLTKTNQVTYLYGEEQSGWRTSCNIDRRWRVSDDESRKVTSEGEGACSPHFKVRSHLPLRGKLGWMTPRVGVKTTLTNGNASLGALVPKQGPHSFAHLLFQRNSHLGLSV
jgi:hypothetical protein